MNKFPLEIDGKEYTLTVNRRTNTLAKAPQERLAKLLDQGVSTKVLAKLAEAKNEDELMELLKKNNVPVSAVASLSQAGVEEYEEMFFRCLQPEHPVEREEALALLDKAEAEYGWENLTKAMEVMSARGFTLNAADKKRILWAETAAAGKDSPAG